MIETQYVRRLMIGQEANLEEERVGLREELLVGAGVRAGGRAGVYEG